MPEMKEAMLGILPAPIRSLLRKLRAVIRRLRIWVKVAHNIKGASDNDTAILNQALRRAPFSVWSHLHRWQFPMVDADCTVASRGVGTFRVRGRTDDLFHVLPRQEPAVEAAVRDWLRPGDAFVDAGSNIGFYTVLAARLVGPEGRVIACEMIPATADILRDHVAMNGCTNVTIHQGALAPTAGELVEATVPPGKYGSASIARRSGEQVVAVRTITLADALRDVPRVRLMKMDLEGSEPGALQGLGPALTKVDAIVYEDRDGPETTDFLTARGFHCRRIDGANTLAARQQTGTA